MYLHKDPECLNEKCHALVLLEKYFLTSFDIENRESANPCNQIRSGLSYRTPFLASFLIHSYLRRNKTI